jgi:uroporphyrinogen decarboxylase
MEILDDLVEAGIDGLNPIDPSAEMDIGFIKQTYGDKLILVGNVDGSRILPFGTPDEVIEEVASCIRLASPGGGHFIQCGCGELMPDVPLENALAYFGAVKEFGKYPIKPL